MVIPALNEEQRITAAVSSARKAGAAEVIVVDGGSRDATAARALEAGARVIAGSRGRALQMNAGAAAASGDILLFLHADCELPVDAARQVVSALDRGALSGAFRLRFIESDFRLRVAERMINARSSVFGLPWGDQAQFMGRSTFESIGGFRPLPILEDYEFCMRMKRLGRLALVPAYVLTSGRRVLERGLLRTAWTNWRIIAGYHRGRSLDELAALYRS